MADITINVFDSMAMTETFSGFLYWSAPVTPLYVNPSPESMGMMEGPIYAGIVAAPVYPLVINVVEDESMTIYEGTVSAARNTNQPATVKIPPSSYYMPHDDMAMTESVDVQLVQTDWGDVADPSDTWNDVP